jgi:hypothetical protein
LIVMLSVCEPLEDAGLAEIGNCVVPVTVMFRVPDWDGIVLASPR